MPDIKTAFSNAFYKAPDIQKAIAEWGDTEAAPIKTQEKQMERTKQYDQYLPDPRERKTFPSNDADLTMSELVFNFVRDNPLRGRAHIVDALEGQGYKQSSINTLISQSVLCGTIQRNELGQHTVTINKFKPVTQRMVLKARKVKQKNSAGIAALKPQASAAPVQPRFKTAASTTSNTPVSITPPADIDALLNSLTFNQAIGLYKKLKTMLGEV